MHIELQQRGIEFSQLFRKYDHLRPALLERMPPMETARPQANGIIGMVNGEQDGDEEKLAIDHVSPAADSNALLDLLGSSDLAVPLTITSTVLDTPSPVAANVNNNDLLDLLGGLDLSTTTVSPTVNEQLETSSQIFRPTSPNFLVDGLLNTTGQNEVTDMIVLDKSGLKITFKMDRAVDTPDLLVINMSALNSTTLPLTDFLFQAAVPRVNFRFL